MLVIPALGEVQLAQDESGKTVWEGVYTEDQAKRGENLYNSSCSSCHRADLSGYDGALKGARFIERWAEDSLDSLYANIKATMPRNNPGSLTADNYLNIVAYVLQQNSFPAGSADLKPDTLKRILVIGKVGPQPLPSGALVQTYGCLTEGPPKTWMLVRATDAVRTRNPDKSSEVDLKSAVSKPPGTSNYRLIDAAFYHAEAQKDHKVEVKGFSSHRPVTASALHR